MVSFPFTVSAPCVIPAQIVESNMNLAIWILGFSISLNKSVSSLFDCLQSLHFKSCKCMTVESIFGPTIRIKKTYNLWLFFFCPILMYLQYEFYVKKKKEQVQATYWIYSHTCHQEVWHINTINHTVPLRFHCYCGKVEATHTIPTVRQGSWKKTGF